MKASSEKKKQLLLKKIKTAIASQVKATTANQAALFCDMFFKRVSLTELSHETPENVTAMVIMKQSLCDLVVVIITSAYTMSRML